MTSINSGKSRVSKVDLASVYRNNESDSMPTFERSLTMGHSIDAAKSGSRKIKFGDKTTDTHGERHQSVKSGNMP